MADAEHIHLELVTPDGVKLDEQVTEVTAPSVDGEFGVLPGHRPLLAALKTGIVTYKRDGETHRVAVGAGFVEVADDEALILTDHFMREGDVDPVRARLELKEADQALAAFEGDPASPEYAELVERELWAAARLELYGDPPPPTVRREYQVFSREAYAELSHGEAGGEGDERAPKH